MGFMRLIPGHRNAVRALVLRDGAVLVQRKITSDGLEKFTLPGGAPELGESLETGLKRECLEEIGCEITIERLLFLADYFKPRETEPVTYRHQLEVLFACDVPEDYVPMNGPKPDKHQVDVVWLPLGQLRHKNFMPVGFKGYIDGSITSDTPYLGRID